MNLFTHLFQLHIYTTTPTFKTIHTSNIEAKNRQEAIASTQPLLQQLKTQYPNSIIKYTVEAY